MKCFTRIPFDDFDFRMRNAGNCDVIELFGGDNHICCVYTSNKYRAKHFEIRNRTEIKIELKQNYRVSSTHQIFCCNDL